MCVDFDLLQASNTTSSHPCTLSYPLTIWRICHLPLGQTEDMGWYFKDDDLWRGCVVRKLQLDNEPPRAEKYLSLLVLLFRRMERCSPQLAAKPSSSSSVWTLRVPSDSRSYRWSTPSTSPVCDVYNRNEGGKAKANLCSEKSNLWCYTWQAWRKPTLPQAAPEMFAGDLNFQPRLGGKTSKTQFSRNRLIWVNKVDGWIHVHIYRKCFFLLLQFGSTVAVCRYWWSLERLFHCKTPLSMISFWASVNSMYANKGAVCSKV